MLAPPAASISKSPVEEVGEAFASERLVREATDRPLFPDFTDEASPFSESPFDRTVDVLGLSVLEEPGILDRRLRRDLEDSLVSDLLIGGPWSIDPRRDPDPPSLEFWFPILCVAGTRKSFP
jgi:hypothetical protein